MRRNRHLGAGLRVAADTRTFLKISCHRSVSLQFQNPRPPGNAHRGIGMRAWFTHRLLKTLSFALGDAIRRPRDTPIWKLEAALKCRSCKKGRYARRYT